MTRRRCGAPGSAARMPSRPLSSHLFLLSVDDRRVCLGSTQPAVAGGSGRVVRLITPFHLPHSPQISSSSGACSALPIAVRASPGWSFLPLLTVVSAAAVARRARATQCCRRYTRRPVSCESHRLLLVIEN